MVLPEESSSAIVHTHRKEPSISELADFTFLELQLPPDHEQGTATINEFIVDETKPKLPESHLVLITDSDAFHGSHRRTGSQEVLNSLTNDDLELHEVHGKLKVLDWKGKTFYSDYIAQGLKYLNEHQRVVMLFETPRSSPSDHSFHNKSSFKFHDWPPTQKSRSKARSVLGPCRYAMMSGSAFPTFLRDPPPEGLVDHWKEALPYFKECTFVSKINTERDTVYAYIPVEDIPKHVNDPHVHYHLAGKDAIHLMTQKTTKLLPDTKTVRPCVVKTTHSQGSKGIFVIQDDDDEVEFEAFLRESGNPTFVVTEFVDIQRNVACHFFMHPDGETVVWFGSNENKRGEDGKFMMFDSLLCMDDQEELKKLQLPFVEEVVNYCHALNYWGFMGIDVLFDSNDNGFLVDINPRVTGSCPALMALFQLKQKYAFNNGLFRRNGDIFYRGNPKQLFQSVSRYNEENEGKSRIVIHSFFQSEEREDITEINISVHGRDLEQCRMILNSYAQPLLPVE